MGYSPKTVKSRSSNLPEVISELGRLGTDKHILLIRLVRYQHPLIGRSAPMLDIRQYYENKKNPDGTVFTGYSSNGVSLTINDLHKLYKMLPEIISESEKIAVEKEKNNGIS